jgi:hypothetical protein
MAEPPILTRLKQQLRTKGMAPGMAAAVAIKTLQNSGSLKKGSTKATPQGNKRSKMGAAGRAIDRAAKASGHEAHQFRYSKMTNRATLKD